MNETALRDKALGKILRRMFSEHPRLKTLALDIGVKGGVAHIYGRVKKKSDIHLVRSTAGLLNGITGVWDVLGTRSSPPMVLDIGCADKKQFPDAKGVDCRPCAGVDVVADLEKKIPFKDNSVDCIFAVHCLEHLHNLIPAMNELHRILSPQGAIHIMTPNTGCTNATADPTHVRFFNRQTFKYFCARRPGIPAFRPIHVCETVENVFCDLAPVKSGARAPSAGELALFFE